MIVVYFNMHWMPCFTLLNLVHYCAHKTGPRYFNSFQQDWLALVALNPSMTGWNGLKWIEPVRGSTLMYIATANALQRQEFGTIGASTSRVGAFVEEGSWSVHLHGVSLAQLGLCWPMSVLPLFSYLMLFEFTWTFDILRLRDRFEAYPGGMIWSDGCFWRTFPVEGVLKSGGRAW